eukprot:144364-Rhodomonas_salina.3
MVWCGGVPRPSVAIDGTLPGHPAPWSRLDSPLSRRSGSASHTLTHRPRGAGGEAGAGHVPEGRHAKGARPDQGARGPRHGDAADRQLPHLERRQQEVTSPHSAARLHALPAISRAHVGARRLSRQGSWAWTRAVAGAVSVSWRASS